LQRGFAVFDSAVADRHLTEGELGFSPIGFDIFAEFPSHCCPFREARVSKRASCFPVRRGGEGLDLPAAAFIRAVRAVSHGQGRCGMCSIIGGPTGTGLPMSGRRRRAAVVRR
jgi:hypothetical protein